MFCGVPPEAVGTVVYTFLKKRNNSVLHSAILCPEVGHADLAFHYVIGVSIILISFVVKQPVVCNFRLILVCPVAKVRPVGFVSKMVCDNVHNNADSVFMGFVAHCFKVCFIAKCASAGVVNGKAGRLVKYPPVSNAYIFCVFLGNLNRRRLDCGVAAFRNRFHLRFDVVERPVPGVQYDAFLNAVCKAVICSSGGLCVLHRCVYRHSREHKDADCHAKRDNQTKGFFQNHHHSSIISR